MTHSEDQFDSPNPFAAPNVEETESAPAGNHFGSIWLHPRRTIRAIVAENPNQQVTLLSCLSGIAQTLDRAATRDGGEEFPLAWVLVASLLLGPLFGLIGVRISTFLVHISGRWIGGQASRRNLLAALAWAYVPQVATLPLWLLAIAIFREELFRDVTPRLEASLVLLGIMLAFGVVQAVAGIWSLVISCNTIAEVQGFRSAWAGLGNIFLAGLLLIVPLIVIVFLVVVVASA